MKWAIEIKRPTLLTLLWDHFADDPYIRMQIEDVCFEKAAALFINGASKPNYCDVRFFCLVSSFLAPNKREVFDMVYEHIKKEYFEKQDGVIRWRGIEAMSVLGEPCISYLLQDLIHNQLGGEKDGQLDSEYSRVRADKIELLCLIAENAGAKKLLNVLSIFLHIENNLHSVYHLADAVYSNIDDFLGMPDAFRLIANLGSHRWPYDEDKLVYAMRTFGLLSWWSKKANSISTQQNGEDFTIQNVDYAEKRAQFYKKNLSESMDSFLEVCIEMIKKYREVPYIFCHAISCLKCFSPIISEMDDLHKEKIGQILAKAIEVNPNPYIPEYTAEVCMTFKDKKIVEVFTEYLRASKQPITMAAKVTLEWVRREIG